MKKVMCFGTFDLTHEGHKYFLAEAKKLGDYLVAVVARDSTVQSIKSRLTLYDERTRLSHVRHFGIANMVILGGHADKLRVIARVRPDIICLGYDQKAFTENLDKNLRKRGIKAEIVRIPSYKPEEHKSSVIRKKMNLKK
jgi:FAD synthetase